MSRAPNAGAAALQAILDLVAAAFTRPGHAIFCDLAAGWVLTPGRRTITRIIEVVDGEGRRAHDAYHRLVRDGAWHMSTLWRLLAVGRPCRGIPTRPPRRSPTPTPHCAGCCGSNELQRCAPRRRSPTKSPAR